MKKVKEKIAAPVKSQKGIEIRYRKQLNKLGKALIIAVREQVLVYLKLNQSSYVVDGAISIIAERKLRFLSDSFNLDGEYELWDEYAEYTASLLKDSQKKLKQFRTKDGIGDQLGVIFRRLNGLFTGTATASFAQVAASSMVEKVGTANKNKFDRTVARATGVDLGGIVQTEGLEDLLTLSKKKNKILITSLPEEYLKQVETIVNNGVVSGARYSTIQKEIISKTGANSKLAGRIKTIAMNEVQTINSQMTLRRSESLGIKKGIYRTSQDKRVRTCHDELDGIRYLLKKGAWSKTCSKFIQPGITDINCRCTYSPIIEVGEEKLPVSEQEKVEEVSEEALKELERMEAELRKREKELSVLERKFKNSSKDQTQDISQKEYQSRKQKLIEKEKELEARAKRIKGQLSKKSVVDPAEFQNLKNASFKKTDEIFKGGKGKMPASVDMYTTWGSGDINRSLKSVTHKAPEEIKKAIKDLDTLINKTTIESNVLLNRGVKFRSKIAKEKYLNEIKPGIIFKEKSFMSSSMGEIRPDFLGIQKKEPAVRMQILAKKGSKGLSINNYDDVLFPAEKEVLLPRNSTFKMISQKRDAKNKSVTNIVVELLS